MATFNTLEEIQSGIQTDLFGEKPFILRSEQRDAINYAKERFCKKSGQKPNYEWSILPEYKQFLWNAKMRFGKTICALQLAREIGVKRTLIVTHRPVVNENWETDFKTVFSGKIQGNTDLSATYKYGTLFDDEQHDKRKFYELEKFVKTEGNHYVFFVSMQYLRLSELVNEKTLAKNTEKQQEELFEETHSAENEKLKADILNTDWDLVVIDEAHEGTRTALGKRVIDEFLRKEKTKMLHLSGTPFNLYEDFKEEEIYTWDYISEQLEKNSWDAKHPGEENPYAELPTMNILTYDITKNIDNVVDQGGIFTFPEFFRTWTGNPKADHAIMPADAKGRFVHEDEVIKFLNLLCTKDRENNFPFSTDGYRKMFRHTLWVVPHVDQAAALKTLLEEHPIFKRFSKINVAGKGDMDEQKETALDAVNSAIGELPETTSTITISCGRLTTGVTVRPWTAVFYMKGGDSAATYMQTIFRVQSPYTTPDGKMKSSCYVFDFAPDRSLKIVAETAKFSSMSKSKSKKNGDEDITQEQRDKQTVKDFIKLCPVISMDGGKMSPLDVNTIYKQLENVFIDRLVRKGFDDPCLYNQEELNSINPDIINHIGENGGQAPDENRKDAKSVVDLSHMSEEERKKWEESIRRKKAEAEEKAAKKAKKNADFKKLWESWSEDERQAYLQQEAEKAALREKRKEEREEFKKRITNIRGIALRIPLLMYGGADAGDPTEDLTVENFTRKIKDESWEEFMPKGISKEDFNKIRKCFNATRFEEAGKKYRALTREADYMHVDERVKQITEIFSYFRNPDKETVLTPWRVVNMHMSNVLGGYCFFDDTFDEKSGVLDSPRYIDHGVVTKELFDNVDDGGEMSVKILEINSKTGLYPLYVAYALYRRRLKEYIKAKCINPDVISIQEEQVVWDDVIVENIYTICNTPMAVGITRRTLLGFRETEKKANIKAEKIVEKAINDKDALIKLITSEGFWRGTRSNNMIEFNAIVGNPPYQIKDGGNSNSAKPIYHLFVDIARRIAPSYISMIMPARWFVGGKEPESFRRSMMTDKHISKMYDFENFEWVFPSADIAGGICYFLWDKNHKGDCLFINKFQAIDLYSMTRPLDTYEIIIRQNNAIPIVKHIMGLNINDGKTLDKIISSRKPFGLPTNYRPADFGTPCWFKQKIGLKTANPDDYTDDNHLAGKWKLLIPKSPIAGQTDFSKPVGFYYEGNTRIAKPGEICTESYIVAFASDREQEVFSFRSYLFTKIVRFLLLQSVISQDVTKQNYRFVPDLGKYSIEYDDDYLRKEWGITDEQWQYIDSRIKDVSEMNVRNTAIIDDDDNE